jgi:hypothetical protein
MERRFQITVRGVLDPRFSIAFDQIEVGTAGNNTVLCGRLVDAAFLDGILAYLRALGVELVRVETSDPDSTGAGIDTERGDKQ